MPTIAQLYPSTREGPNWIYGGFLLAEKRFERVAPVFEAPIFIKL